MMDNQIMIDYYLEGNSLAAVERKYKISPYRFKKILKSNNVHIRTRHEQCILENQRRGYSVNHNYFSELTLENTYWLGFIAADGTVRKDRNSIKIGLKAEDKEILKQLKYCLQSEAPIKYYTTKKNFPVVEFEFSSKQIKEDLSLYSIVPNKTYIGITMKNIPDQFKLSFIKGYYDGDGSYSCGKIKIVSHTSEILEEIQSFLPQKSHLYYFEDKEIYSLEMSTKPSLEFLDSIYQLNTPKLQRKYDKYCEAIKLRI